MGYACQKHDGPIWLSTGDDGGEKRSLENIINAYSDGRIHQNICQSLFDSRSKMVSVKMLVLFVAGRSDPWTWQIQILSSYAHPLVPFLT
jgi:hypothetical protein